jgi:hypothetical protein
MMNPLRNGLLGMVGALTTGALVLGALALGLLETMPMLLTTPTLRATLPAPNLTPLPGSELVATTGGIPRPVSQVVLPASPTACPPPIGWETYIVSSGDDLRKLAETRGSSLEQIKAGNCLISDMILSDAVIYLPPFAPLTYAASSTISAVDLSPVTTELTCVQPAGWITYTVKPGDNLTRIAVTYRISISYLKQVNCLVENTIRPGWKLWVPNVPTSTFTTTPTATQQPPNTIGPSSTFTVNATLTATHIATAAFTFTSTTIPTIPPNPAYTNIPTAPAATTTTPVFTLTPFPTSGIPTSTPE